VGSELNTFVHGRRVRLLQSTTYPNEGRSQIDLELDEACAFTLALRLPGWCRKPGLSVNGAEIELAPIAREGFAYLHRTWSSGDRLVLTLPMPVERMRAHPGVRADAGKVAIQRGPIVYCLEELDNGKDLWALSIPAGSPMEARLDPCLLGGTVVVEGVALRRSDTSWSDNLYSTVPPVEDPATIRAVPYRVWGNRGPGAMQVWTREQP
jgi:DUF1680 family protein